MKSGFIHSKSIKHGLKINPLSAKKKGLVDGNTASHTGGEAEVVGDDDGWIEPQ